MSLRVWRAYSRGGLHFILLSFLRLKLMKLNYFCSRAIRRNQELHSFSDRVLGARALGLQGF